VGSVVYDDASGVERSPYAKTAPIWSDLSQWKSTLALPSTSSARKRSSEDFVVSNVNHRLRPRVRTAVLCSSFLPGLGVTGEQHAGRTVAEGNAVAGRFRCSGTHRGEFLGEGPTGKRMEVEEVFFLRVEDGKFVNYWALEDSLGRMRQLGLLPSAKRTS
jgi:predicted ester cyclase